MGFPGFDLTEHSFTLLIWAVWDHLTACSIKVFTICIFCRCISVHEIFVYECVIHLLIWSFLPFNFLQSIGKSPTMFQSSCFYYIWFLFISGPLLFCDHLFCSLNLSICQGSVVVILLKMLKMAALISRFMQ